MITWALRFPRILSALAVSLTLTPALIGAADPPPLGFPEHPDVLPATVECAEGSGTISVVGQVFPTLSQADEGQTELPLTVAAGLPDAEAVELELTLVPHEDTLPGVTAEEMGEAAERAGAMPVQLAGEDGNLLSGDEAPLLAWEDWDPPLGFYAVHVDPDTFTTVGAEDCEVVTTGPISSVRVGSDDELSEALETFESGTAANDAAPVASGVPAYLPWIAVGMGVLGALCLAVPAVLYLRRRP